MSAQRRRRGRPPAATREQVLAAAGRAFGDCQRVDVQAIAEELGLGRVSIYRWFGSREGLLAEMLVAGVQREYDRAFQDAQGAGGARVLDALDRVMRAYAGSEPMQHFVATEPLLARRLITDPNGTVHPRKVTELGNFVEAEIAHHDWRPQLDSYTLAYVCVHLMEDMTFAGPAGRGGDRERLLKVLSALLRPATGPDPTQG